MPRRCTAGARRYDHLVCLALSNRIPLKRVDEVLGIVGLETVANRRTGTFSLGMSQRLGIAAALLGDPPVLMFDEPVNGLDPEGIVWVRQMMRALAAEGRTVFVSSHLMSEMALTADHLVVIGRGRLIADTSVSDFIDSSSQQSVRVRSPHGDALAERLRQAGATVRPAPEGEFDVVGMDSAAIGELAAANGFVLHQLATQRASLEEAFMELTHDDRGVPGRREEESVTAATSDAVTPSRSFETAFVRRCCLVPSGTSSTPSVPPTGRSWRRRWSASVSAP